MKQIMFMAMMDFSHYTKYDKWAITGVVCALDSEFTKHYPKIKDQR